MSLPFKTVAVIGAGQKGWQLALEAARAGYQVVLEDVLPSRLRSADNGMRNEVSAFAISNPAAILARISFASTVEDAVRDSDIAIDGVPDELESKLEIFSMIDRMAPPRTVLCSPLDAVSLADVASCTYRPGQCFGFRMDGDHVTVERTSFSDSAVLNRVLEFWRSLGKEARVIADSREVVAN